MIKSVMLLAALSLFTLSVACTTDPETSDDSTSEAAVSGCHQVCPHCSSKPGTECPLSPCYLQCNDGQGHQVCPDTELCIQGYKWQPNACKCVH
jgi:hypothetical protein